MRIMRITSQVPEHFYPKQLSKLTPLGRADPAVTPFHAHLEPGMAANLSSRDELENRVKDLLLKPKEGRFSLPLARGEALWRGSAFARLAVNANSLLCLH